MAPQSPPEHHPPLASYAPPADAPPAAGDGARAERVPTGTTPTYELEMLISGTVTFGLLQLPGALDAAVDAVRGRLTGGWIGAALVAWYLAKAMLFALIASFLLHLATRAYWVGLVGLDSVFPRGVRWDRLTTTGPITREEYARRLPTLRRTIERLDNVASTIFSMAFLQVLIVLFSALALAAVAAVTWAADRLRLPRGAGAAIVVAALSLLFGASLVAWAVDKRMGARLRPGSAPDRAVRLVARLTYRVFLLGVYGPIMYTLLTNVRKRIAFPLIYLGMFASFGLATLDVRRHLTGMRAEVGRALPARTDIRGMSASKYESMRVDGAVPSRVPMIQSDVIEGPYVRLFVPYDPENDERALRRACPEAPKLVRPQVQYVEPTAADTAAYDRAYACLARVRSVTLDGRPVADLAYRYHLSPQTRLAGVLAYLPTDGLAKGMHTLVVRAAPDVAGRARPGTEIVFWR